MERDPVMTSSDNIGPLPLPHETSEPLLACVVLSFRNQPQLCEAVRSLQNQDERVEIVVVNSGGGNAAKTLESQGIHVRVIEREERLYAGAARNLGIQATSAPYIAFLAADCVAEPGWIAERLRLHQSGVLAVSSAVTNHESNNVIAWASYLSLFSRRMPGTPPDLWLHYGISYARTLFDQYGLFDETLRTGEDTEFNSRFQGKTPIIPAPLVQSAHRHPTTVSELLRDQFARGKRTVLAYQQIYRQPFRAPVAKNALRNAWVSLRVGLRATRHRERLYVMGAGFLMLPAAAAYAFGAISAARSSNAVIPISTAEALPLPEQPQARVRLLAILVFRNEMKYLPDYFRNVAPHVDGIVALDDGSTDGSGEFVRNQPGVLELVQRPCREPHVWDEPENRRLVLEAAYRHAPDWLVVVDADERLERGFRERAESEIAHASLNGTLAFRIWMRELWDFPDTFRVDGIWGKKYPFRLFKARPDHEYDGREFHGYWAPLNSTQPGQFSVADLVIYHLKTMHFADRMKRQERYKQLDPQNIWQEQGYDYMTDEIGLRVSQFPTGREYEPLPDVL
jgi:glycosyltransferase involved in cell wall biosynthesis